MQKIIVKLSFTLLLICSKVAWAQFPMAAHLVLAGDYEGARKYYSDVLSKDSLNFNANQEMGLLLIQYFDDKSEALRYLDRAIRIVKKKDMLPELYLGYAQALHYDSQYESAEKYYEKIGPLANVAANADKIKRIAKLGVENCKYGAANRFRVNKQFVISNMGDGINTSKPEFMPVAEPDGLALMYTTNREVVPGTKKDDPDIKLRGDFFISPIAGGKTESGRVFYRPTNTLAFLEGLQEQDALMYASTNGQHLLLLRNGQLYLTDLVDGKWTVGRHLPAPINAASNFEGMACISNDGKMIIFSLEKAGGFGGKDLYRSVTNEKGDWSEPENLGEEINSAEDEEAPALSYDEKYLYYSSKGLEGYGGFDVYKCKITSKGTYKPVNMGLPVNSPADDIGFFLDKTGTAGYMASSRKGTKGELDVYRVLTFDTPDEEHCITAAPSKPGDDVYVNIAFRDSVFVNDSVHFNAGVSKINGRTILNYFWKINDTAVANETAQLHRKFAREGRYKVSLVLATFSEAEANRKDYCLSKEVHVFSPNVVDVFFEPLVKANENRLALKGTVDETKLRLDSSKKDILKIQLEPVFFNTNKSDLRKDAQEAIKKNISKMKVDPTIIVKLTAMTDPRASKEYNLALSQKRASSVVAALEKAGIKKKRIIAVLAVGEEEESVKKCNGDAACIENIYQHNRRVEFKIVGAEYIAPKPAPVKKSAKPKSGGAAKKKTGKK